MKLLGIFIAGVFSQNNYTPDPPNPPVVVDPINCFHCDAANMTHCQDIGEEKPCPTDVPMACMIEVRKREGQIEGVSLNHIIRTGDISFRCFDYFFLPRNFPEKIGNFIFPGRYYDQFRCAWVVKA